MTHLAARVLATVRRRQLFGPGARLVAAVSGGADSVALAFLLRELAAADRLGLAGLAHLNHGLRGEESERDAAFCARLAADLGLPLDVETGDVAAHARTSGRSLEDAARTARYEFLERARQRLGADVIAVAHTKDDQAETVLMRLLRGSGLGGLSAIHPRRAKIVRPLIDLSRAELVEYLRARQIGWVEDSSNRDPRFLRTRIRHELMPWLTGNISAGVAGVLARTADVVNEEDRLLARLAEAARTRLQDEAGTIDLAGLMAEPVAIRRRVLRAAAAPLLGREPRVSQVDAALAWAQDGQGRRFRLSDLVLERRGDGRIRLSRTERSESGPDAGWRHVAPVPGVIDVPEAGLRFTARPGEPALAVHPRSLGPWGVVVPADIGPRLVVRGWEPGDRLRPLGAPGRKKVQDLFVDRRVQPGERRRIPVVAAPDGRIVWVAGHALAEEFAVTPATKSVVVLSFEPLGGL
jgi:tRNA(Ile)-lysidine synthase